MAVCNKHIKLHISNKHGCENILKRADKEHDICYRFYLVSPVQSISEPVDCQPLHVDDAIAHERHVHHAIDLATLDHLPAKR